MAWSKCQEDKKERSNSTNIQIGHIVNQKGYLSCLLQEADAILNQSAQAGLCHFLLSKEPSIPHIPQIPTNVNRGSGLIGPISLLPEGISLFSPVSNGGGTKRILGGDMFSDGKQLPNLLCNQAILDQVMGRVKLLVAGATHILMVPVLLS